MTFKARAFRTALLRQTIQFEINLNPIFRKKKKKKKSTNHIFRDNLMYIVLVCAPVEFKGATWKQLDIYQVFLQLREKSPGRSFYNNGGCCGQKLPLPHQLQPRAEHTLPLPTMWDETNIGIAIATLTSTLS